MENVWERKVNGYNKFSRLKIESATLYMNKPLSMFAYVQELPRVPLLRSNSEVEKRRDHLVQMERSLSKEAREILPGLIIECLDNDPSNRPTSKRLIEALGTY